MHVVDPNGAVRTLLAPELEVTIEEVLQAGHLDYAAEREANLLRGSQVTAEASSYHGNDQKPGQAVDGNFGTRWHSDLADELPWLRLSLRKPLRANRLLLSHAHAKPSHRAAPRPSRVEVVINGKLRLTFDMDPDALAKTTVDLGKPQTVRTLELHVLASRDRKLGTDAVGFGEVELQLAR